MVKRKGEWDMLKQKTGCRPSWIRGALKGSGTSVICAFLCAAVLAWFVDAEVIKMEQIGYGILVGHLLSVFLGAKTAMAGMGKDGLYAAGTAGGVYYLALLIINGLFFGGNFTGLGVTCILVLLGTTAAVVTAGEKRSRKRHRRYKIPK